MRIQSEIEADIDCAVEERKEAQRLGTKGVLGAMSERIDALYVELRESRAHDRYGSREKIAQQARVERELEKLGRPATT